LWFVLNPGYESTSKILLQGPREEEELLGEVQIATTLVVLDQVAAELPWGTTGRQLQGAVSAAVGDGNVITITGAASTPERAQLLTDRVAHQYIVFAGKIASDATNEAAAQLQQRRALVQEEIDEITPRIARLEDSPLLPQQTSAGIAARAELDQLRARLTQAEAELDEIGDAAREAEAEATNTRGGLIVIEPPVAGTVAAPTIQQLAGGGALVFAALGAFALIAAARWDLRLTVPEQIGAALGSGVLAEVDVAVESHAKASAAAWRRGRRLRDLLRDDARWFPPAGRPSDGWQADVRYTRLLSKLRDHASNAHLRVLVVIADDDLRARLAVVRLAAVAAADQTPVMVLTDDDELAELVRAGADAEGAPVTVASSGLPAPEDLVVLRVVAASAARPVVPHCDGVTGAMVALAVGSRTAWELVALAGACADAGHPVIGAVVVWPVRATSVERPDASTSAPSTAEAMAGST
jgi:hypothetical protein